MVANVTIYVTDHTQNRHVLSNRPHLRQDALKPMLWSLSIPGLCRCLAFRLCPEIRLPLCLRGRLCFGSWFRTVPKLYILATVRHFPPCKRCHLRPYILFDLCTIDQIFMILGRSTADCHRKHNIPNQCWVSRYCTGIAHWWCRCMIKITKHGELWLILKIQVEYISNLPQMDFHIVPNVVIMYDEEMI